MFEVSPGGWPTEASPGGWPDGAETMANIKSQIKRNRQNERRRLRNKGVRSEAKTRVKNAIRAAETGADDRDEAVRQAVKRLDKAAAKGIIHPNQAANRKSRLTRRLARLQEEPAQS